MTTTEAIKVTPFDASEYLDDEDTIASYISAAIEADDQDVLLLALADVAKARGMAKVAADAGLGRESLYKALRPGANPKFDTIKKLMHALGVTFTAVPNRKS
ncbi:putative addiction module antidote protein [Burkholderia multivorans]|uniref:Putative DNA binding protein n=1 Tax=Burkholderia pseudomultivorans TaxID=1207504 RepID=A0A6P2HFR5_9BURK|nr:MULTISPECIES: addiction module antidote protein [Burkholderia]RQU89789.1 putative addiction module antidote protein [Burkholderia cenocepacia]TPQ45790.1 putative addiction module antidote protein [Burkholderia ubonensis]MBJ9656640.1 putative addiction module antidote protein [Burkholderia multivorans]MBJ9682448.1 putative addiction module antidote protein [Burkholderia multivorans]MBR7922715.1 putative addiction module antidote protein [Burkholderia multivorans]